MATRKGEANMTRKASGTERQKLSRSRQHMQDLEEADKLAPRFEEFQEDLDAIVQDTGEESFDTLAVEYIALNAQIAEAEARKEAIKAIIKPIVEEAGIDKMVSDVWALEKVTSRTPRKLDPTKLVMAGVHLDVIEKCYIGGDPYTYVQIRMRRQQ